MKRLKRLCDTEIGHLYEMASLTVEIIAANQGGGYVNFT